MVIHRKRWASAVFSHVIIQPGFYHPQPTSSQLPALYGFIPRTCCGRRVQRLSQSSRRKDGGPRDMCVLSEREIARGI
jgi:inorganic pyrophosphatase